MNQEYKELYKKKLTTADEAVKCIHDGDWVDYGWSVSTSYACDKALAARMPELHDIKVYGGVLLRAPEIFKVENAKEHFCWNSWHMGGADRRVIPEGFSFYNPMRFSELPRYVRETGNHARVAMYQVAPMDKHGYFNFGPSASATAALSEMADIVIVEVNENMPRCLGGFDECIHISQVDMIVETGNPDLDTIPAAGEPTEVDRTVAKYIVDEICDGACLQLGIGGMPNAVGKMIAESDLKHLGVHTEMYVDAFYNLAKAGKIDGSMKNIDKGRQAYAFAAGSKEMYDYLDENPACMSAPVDYTNDYKVISQLDNFMSINNAIDIDLFGQVNAESAGTRHISGAGGQLDFVLGAYASNGGKSFICMSSTFTTKDGTVKSRITPTLNNGSIVTDTRANIHYFVTEYGIANLKGLPSWQKAERIINLAHPDFRDELIASAEKMNIWRQSNKR